MAEGGGFDISSMLADRNFQNALAGFGAGLDPQGVGGALGNAVIGMNKSKAAGETVDATSKADKSFKSQLLSMLGGGMTPKDSEGLTSASVDGSNITLKGTLPGSSPAGEVPGGGNNPNTGQRLQDISPFYSALIGR